jgi:hypothetical protein
MSPRLSKARRNQNLRMQLQLRCDDLSTIKPSQLLDHSYMAQLRMRFHGHSASYLTACDGNPDAGVRIRQHVIVCCTTRASFGTVLIPLSSTSAESRCVFHSEIRTATHVVAHKRTVRNDTATGRYYQ